MSDSPYPQYLLHDKLMFSPGKSRYLVYPSDYVERSTLDFASPKRESTLDLLRECREIKHQLAAEREKYWKYIEKKFSSGKKPKKRSRREEFVFRRKRLSERLEEKKLYLTLEREGSIANTPSRDTRVNWIISDERENEGSLSRVNTTKWNRQRTLQHLLEIFPDRFSGLRNCMKFSIQKDDGYLSEILLTGDSAGNVRHSGLATCKSIDCPNCGGGSREDRFLEISKMCQAAVGEKGVVIHMVATKAPEVDDYLSVLQVLRANEKCRAYIKNFNKRKGTTIGYFGIIESAFSRKTMNFHHSGTFIKKKKYLHIHLHGTPVFSSSDYELYGEEVRLGLQRVWREAITSLDGFTFMNGVPAHLKGHCDEEYLQRISFHWEKIDNVQAVTKYLVKLKDFALEMIGGSEKGGDEKSEELGKGRGLKAIIDDITKRLRRNKFDTSFDHMEDIRLLLTWFDAMYRRRRSCHHNLKYWINKFDVLRNQKINEYIDEIWDDVTFDVAPEHEAYMNSPLEKRAHLYDEIYLPPQLVEGRKEEKDRWFPVDSLEVYLSSSSSEAEIVWEDGIDGWIWNAFSLEGKTGLITNVFSRYHYDNFGEIPYKQLKSIQRIGFRREANFASTIRDEVRLWIDLWGQYYETLSLLKRKKKPRKRRKSSRESEFV